MTKAIAALALTILCAAPARGDVGLIVLEPVNTLGYWTRVGHAATYLSNICPDGSPVRMRLCTPGELGGVVSRYAPFSEHEAYDWAIVPFGMYIHGFASDDLAPLVVTRRLQDLVEHQSFAALFSHALTPGRDGDLPAGQWKATLANRFVRSLYVFTVKTTLAQDAAIVDEFNRQPNASCFNFFYGNCSNQAKQVFELVLPHTVGDRVGGMTMEAPKGLAKALVRHAMEHPELELRAQWYPQLPGAFAPSRSALFPLENMYRSLPLLPWWHYDGFRVVGAAAILYHEVLSRFSLSKAVHDFGSPRAAALTREEHRLRTRMDVVRRAFSRAVARGDPWSRLATIEARLNRRLLDVAGERRTEIARLAGSEPAWRERRLEFRAFVRAAARSRRLPASATLAFERYQGDGRLSRHLLETFEHEGEPFVNAESGGPWIRLATGDGAFMETGLSRAEVESGDPRAAVLVLAAAVDASLNGSPSRREDLPLVDDLLLRLHHAVDTLAHFPNPEP